ncbi:p74 protein [Danaus plexippus plexippus]|uniref:P74 protein n=1 Tax=Danaus plexippus plexippus TaxID=278856 RepID=A0A212FB48_DANPL|nr:p74 protein [Danaus plexippus plexippus]
MAYYTQVDLQNASMYAKQRLLLHYIKFINEKYPHIGSEVAYTVKQADPEKDYYFPETFRSSAIVVDVNITKDLCEKISCNSATNKGACKFGDQASLYRIGDMEKFKVQCQPACYNLKNQLVFDDDGKEVVQSHRFEWNKNNKCEFVNSAVTWMEKPFYRSMEIYEKRVNDLELGFNYDEDLDMYFYNKYYCNVYFDTYDPATKNCKTAWYDFIANVVVGENIMKLLKAGISYIENGNTIIPSRLPSPPKIDDKWKLENWRKDINSKFVIPNTEIKFNVTEGESAAAPNPLAAGYASDTGTTRDETKDESGDDDETKDGNSSQNVVEAILVGLLESIVSTEFLESIAVDVGTTILVTQLKNFALKILKKLSVSMAEAVLKLNVQLFENILKASVVNVYRYRYSANGGSNF